MVNGKWRMLGWNLVQNIQGENSEKKGMMHTLGSQYIEIKILENIVSDTYQTLLCMAAQLDCQSLIVSNGNYFGWTAEWARISRSLMLSKLSHASICHTWEIWRFRKWNWSKKIPMWGFIYKDIASKRDAKNYIFLATRFLSWTQREFFQTFAHILSVKKTPCRMLGNKKLIVPIPPLRSRPQPGRGDFPIKPAAVITEAEYNGEGRLHGQRKWRIIQGQLESTNRWGKLFKKQTRRVPKGWPVYHGEPTFQRSHSGGWHITADVMHILSGAYWGWRFGFGDGAEENRRPGWIIVRTHSRGSAFAFILYILLILFTYILYISCASVYLVQLKDCGRFWEEEEKQPHADGRGRDHFPFWNDQFKTSWKIAWTAALLGKKWDNTEYKRFPCLYAKSKSITKKNGDQTKFWNKNFIWKKITTEFVKKTLLYVFNGMRQNDEINTTGIQILPRPPGKSLPLLKGRVGRVEHVLDYFEVVLCWEKNLWHDFVQREFLGWPFVRTTFQDPPCLLLRAKRTPDLAQRSELEWLMGTESGLSQVAVASPLLNGQAEAGFGLWVYDATKMGKSPFTIPELNSFVTGCLVL